MTADLLPIDSDQPKRKSASHGEAGYARNARDAYFTEPWVTQALVAAVQFRIRIDGNPSLQPEVTDDVWEPAVGDGRMAAELVRAGYRVRASDVHDYGWPGTEIVDFTRLEIPRPGRPASQLVVAPAVVTNPPFDLAKEFIRAALAVTRPYGGKVAILQRHEFDAPRSNWPLFERPFAAKLILPRRPRWSTEDKASPRFPYAWYLWDWAHEGPPVIRFLDEAKTGQGALL